MPVFRLVSVIWVCIMLFSFTYTNRVVTSHIRFVFCVHLVGLWCVFGLDNANDSGYGHVSTGLYT